MAATALLSALAAIAGVALALLGRTTPLVGACGDLLPGPLSRAQAGFPHPNLLASFCVFASAVVAREDARLPRRVRLAVQAALTAAVLLTTSRAILAFGLSALLRHAHTPQRRRVARLAGGDGPARDRRAERLQRRRSTRRGPGRCASSTRPRRRLLAAGTSLDTLLNAPALRQRARAALPGLRGRMPFDAHLTPLNVAATLGLPALAALVLLAAGLWRARRRPDGPHHLGAARSDRA